MSIKGIAGLHNLMNSVIAESAVVGYISDGSRPSSVGVTFRDNSSNTIFIEPVALLLVVMIDWLVT